MDTFVLFLTYFSFSYEVNNCIEHINMSSSLNSHVTPAIKTEQFVYTVIKDMWIVEWKSLASECLLIFAMKDL